MAEPPAGERPRYAGLLDFLLGLAILVALNTAGNWFVRVVALPVPGSVVGMLVLTWLLETRIMPMHRVRSASEFLVRHLALLYVPAGVALIAYAAVVREGLVAITAAALASLVAVLLVVGLVVERMARDG